MPDSTALGLSCWSCAPFPQMPEEPPSWEEEGSCALRLPSALAACESCERARMR